MRTPMTCEPDKLHLIPRDNVSSGDFWFMVDGNHVVLTEQPPGKPAEATVRLPRRVFNTFLRWYVTGSKTGKIR